MIDREILIAALRDFWPCFALMYAAAGLLLISAILWWNRDVEDIGTESVAKIGPAALAFIVAVSALAWPLGLAIYIVRQIRETRCSWL